MVVVVLVAVGVFGVRVAWARAASAPEPVAAGVGTSAPSALVSRTPGVGVQGVGVPGGAGSSSRPPTPQSGTGGAGRLVVHVVGQVRRPGVVVLPPGARVGEALARAGGALPGADLGALNLARALVDGEQVRVPRPGEAPPAAAEVPGGAGAAGSAGAAGGGTAGSAAPVNLNTATVAVLEELPGVGPVLAQRIVDWRTEHGRFTSVDELAEVSGIGEKMFAALQDKVTV
jgi:competence protein ComEA